MTQSKKDLTQVNKDIELCERNMDLSKSALELCNSNIKLWEKKLNNHQETNSDLNIKYGKLESNFNTLQSDLDTCHKISNGTNDDIKSCTTREERCQDKLTSLKEGVLNQLTKLNSSWFDHINTNNSNWQDKLDQIEANLQDVNKKHNNVSEAYDKCLHDLKVINNLAETNLTFFELEMLNLRDEADSNQTILNLHINDLTQNCTFNLTEQTDQITKLTNEVSNWKSKFQNIEQSHNLCTTQLVSNILTY